ncbi:MAG: hypothetical protein UT30_C0033G0006 [Candidatus Uhrbacteria bacterium GW2011_GWF2_39_13]|uniref:Uncharacterized protein n=1 Tax=Candidatus Uhrbacteria bacterium GW2011_GWF2_39_13 TaxID=1618995 RepID=A0A0G0PYQ2_9BACT|nr:MAG: hypothetical protein UT30_C0033G0006 [Candidatus Uhrbacteria bacterium GW2011_GWF2_39_13]
MILGKNELGFVFEECLSGRELLEHAGKITHEEALKKAQLEYEKYRRKQREQPSEVEKHFIEAGKEIKLISLKAKKTGTFLK